MKRYPPLATQQLPNVPKWTKAIGVGVVAPGLAIGTGELILWPHLVTTHGPGILWGALLGLTLQAFNSYRLQAEDAVASLQAIGVRVLYTGGHHRKLVILDRGILWEGSLNILSQNDTSEIMRRIKSRVLAQQMTDFLKIEQYLVQ